MHEQTERCCVRTCGCLRRRCLFFCQFRDGADRWRWPYPLGGHQCGRLRFWARRLLFIFFLRCYGFKWQIYGSVIGFCRFPPVFTRIDRWRSLRPVVSEFITRRRMVVVVYFVVGSRIFILHAPTMASVTDSMMYGVLFFFHFLIDRPVWKALEPRG